MGIKIMNEVWSIKGLKPTQKYVLVALADRASDDNHTCWPSMADLKDRTGLSERAIRDAISELESMGFVAVEHRFNKSNLYRLTIKNRAIPANGAPPAANAPPAPNAAPPAGGAGVPAGGAGPDRQEVPPNHHLTHKEPALNQPSYEKLFSSQVEAPHRIKMLMTLEWQPSVQLKARAIPQGVNPDLIKPETLAAFRSYYEAKGLENNQGEWENLLIRWCKTEYASPPKTSQSGPYGRYVEQPMDYPLAEPDKDMYSGPVDTKAATSALAAMREKIKQDGEAF